MQKISLCKLFSRINTTLQYCGDLLLDSFGCGTRIVSVSDRAAHNEIVGSTGDGVYRSYDPLLIVLGRRLIIEDGTDSRADRDQRMIDRLPQRGNFQSG